jgi:hypothetical protein
VCNIEEWWNGIVSCCVLLYLSDRNIDNMTTQIQYKNYNLLLVRYRQKA